MINLAIYTGDGISDQSNASWPAIWALEYGSVAAIPTAANSSGGGKGAPSFSSTSGIITSMAPGNTSWGGDFRRAVGGRGGRPLDYSTGRLFLGGAGDNNDNAAGGGNGGGMVLNSLKWTTASEKNNRYFVLERSSNGTDFVSIGTIEGHGNSSVMQTYYFDDKNPLNGNNYYRLKQVDYDGEFSNSKIILINNDYEDKIIIYPNPNNGEFTINILSQGEDYKLDIIDMEEEQFIQILQRLFRQVLK